MTDITLFSHDIFFNNNIALNQKALLIMPAAIQNCPKNILMICGQPQVVDYLFTPFSGSSAAPVLACSATALRHVAAVLRPCAGICP
jgi:hypothetical protein